jgi:hypothetical protein
MIFLSKHHVLFGKKCIMQTKDVFLGAQKQWADFSGYHGLHLGVDE